ncbi:MAG: LysR family transcriptional regulator [Myxococcales bacterium]|nr:LysR family transcriptional regulator [Myxococcales bacterium]
MLDGSDLAALAALHALLETGSVTGAARRIGLSTPAMSHALARLRARLGDPLLVRSGRGMARTPRAEALRPAVRAALDAAQAVFRAPEDFDPAQIDRALTLSATDYVWHVLGAALDTALAAEAPGLRLQVVPNAVDDGARLRAGQTDLAIGIYGTLPPELLTRPLLSDRLVCVVRQDHPTVGDTITAAEFAALPHIQVAPRGRPGGYVDEQLALRGLSRRVVRAVPFFRAGLELCAASDRILSVSERIARRLGPELGLRILEPPLPWAPFVLSLVWHPRDDADPAHRWVRDRLQQVADVEAGPAQAEARRWLSPTDPTGRL